MSKEWFDHVAGCKKCQQVDTAKPATLVFCCHQGAGPLRDHLAQMQAPKVRAANKAMKKAFTDEFTVSKKKMKEAMKYVEPELFA